MEGLSSQSRSFLAERLPALQGTVKDAATRVSCHRPETKKGLARGAGKSRFQDFKAEIHNTHRPGYWQYLTSDLVLNLMGKTDKKEQP